MQIPPQHAFQRKAWLLGGLHAKFALTQLMIAQVLGHTWDGQVVHVCMAGPGGLNDIFMSGGLPLQKEQSIILQHPNLPEVRQSSGQGGATLSPA